MSCRAKLLTKEEADVYLAKLKYRMEQYRKEHPDVTN